MRFCLSKWYLDCVTATGDAAVLYWASLRWGGLRLHHGAALCHSPTGDSLPRYTMRPGSQPAFAADGTLRWWCGRLRAGGTWRRSADGITRTLLDEADGRIDWHCICPKADATIQIDGRAVRGLGYAEHVTTTLAPGRLPFEESRWGRFLSRTDTVAWIGWRGALSRSWLFTNGVADDGAVISTSTVATHDGDVTLRVSDGQVLRAGRLALTVPLLIRPLISAIPHWRNAEETKWVPRGSVTGPHGTSDGWVIHEVVRWS